MGTKPRGYSDTKFGMAVVVAGILGITGIWVAMSASGGSPPTEVVLSETERRMAESIDSAKAIGRGEIAAREKEAQTSERSNTETDSTPIQSVRSRRANMFEQAILDAFPPDRSFGNTSARDFIAARINSAGYRCATPIEMAQAAAGQYGVGCITNRSGYGKSNYLIDTRSGHIVEI